MSIPPMLCRSHFVYLVLTRRSGFWHGRRPCGCWVWVKPMVRLGGACARLKAPSLKPPARKRAAPKAWVMRAHQRYALFLENWMFARSALSAQTWAEHLGARSLQACARMNCSTCCTSNSVTRAPARMGFGKPSRVASHRYRVDFAIFRCAQSPAGRMNFDSDASFFIVAFFLLIISR